MYTMEKNHLLYETIPHITDSAPYSLHETRQDDHSLPALYLHWHNEMEFLIVEQGSLLFRVEDKSYAIHQGEGIFIPPGLLHSAQNAGNTPICFRAFVLSPDFIVSKFDTNFYHHYLLPILHNNLPYVILLQHNVHWQQMILMHLHTVFYSGDITELGIRGQTLLIWEQLYTNHISKQQTNHMVQKLTSQLSPAFEYMHTHFHAPLTLKELSSRVYLSEGEFCRSFKLLTEMSPFHYLIRYRILQSCEELSQTNKKIADIALSCGFNNISYYNRAFMKLMDMTPSAYRKSIHQNHQTAL